MAIWDTLPGSGTTLMEVLSRRIGAYELEVPGALPDLRSARTLVLASDYSGDHRKAAYRGIGILLSDPFGSARWDATRRELRNRYLADGRRHAYKSLRDTRRSDVLESFLEAAGNLRGVLAVFLIDKGGGDLFGPPGPDDVARLPGLQQWRPHAAERLLQIVHFASVLIAGLSAPGQNLLWITDRDEIAPNDKRLADLAKLFGTITSSYLPHDLGHLRVGTTASDTSDRDLEDLISIPDLAAGALTHALGLYRMRGGLGSGRILLPPPSDLAPKAKRIMNWASDPRHTLRKLFFAVRRIPEERQASLTHIELQHSFDLGL